jgi:hypothetical protein
MQPCAVSSNHISLAHVRSLNALSSSRCQRHERALVAERTRYRSLFLTFSPYLPLLLITATVCNPTRHRHGLTGILRQLLEAGADHTAVNDEGNTPLALARGAEQSAAVALLEAWATTGSFDDAVDPTQQVWEQC